MERETVVNALTNFLRKAIFNPSLEAHPDAHLTNDLGVDSMGAVEFVNMIEDHYQIVITEQEMDGIYTLNKAAELVIAKKNGSGN